MGNKIKICLLVFVLLSLQRASGQTYSSEEISQVRTAANALNKNLEPPFNAEKVKADLATFERLLAEYPNTVMRGTIYYYLLLGNARLNADSTTLQHYAQKFLEFQPLASSYDFVAKTFLKKGIFLEIAIRYAQKAVDIASRRNPFQTPKHAEYLFTLGEAHLSMGNYSEATKMFEKSYEELQKVVPLQAFKGFFADMRNLRLVTALIKMGESYEKAGQFPQAFDSYVRALHLQPKNDEIIHFIRRAFVPHLGSESEYESTLHEIQDNIQQQRSLAVETERLNKEAFVFELESIDGNKIGLNDYQGKVVILNFWAEWCEPCIRELPYLQNLVKEYDKNDVDLLVININVENNPPDVHRKKAKSFAERKGYDFTILLDDGSVAQKYKVPPVPATFVLDRNGTIQFEHRGFSEESDFLEVLRSEVDALLGERVAVRKRIREKKMEREEGPEFSDVWDKIEISPTLYVSEQLPTGTETITFRNIPTNASISIYTSYGFFISELDPPGDALATRSPTWDTEWDLITHNGEEIPAGVYLCRITSPTKFKFARIIVAR